MAFNKFPLFSPGETTRLLLSSVAQRTGRNVQGDTGEGSLAAAPLWVPHAPWQRLRWGRGRKAAFLQHSGTDMAVAESPQCCCSCAFGGWGGAGREAMSKPQSQKSLKKSRELAYREVWGGKIFLNIGRLKDAASCSHQSLSDLWRWTERQGLLR